MPDWVKLDIPSYPKVIKRPMDMGTIRKKLEAHEYLNAQKFHDDFKLMIRNCFTFNPSGTPVNQAGIELQRLFDEKWRGLPALNDVASEGDDEEEGEEEIDDERRRKFITPSLTYIHSHHTQARSRTWRSRWRLCVPTSRD
jgi:hypothetical protein